MGQQYEGTNGQYKYVDTAQRIVTDWDGVTAVVPAVGGWLEIDLMPFQVEHIWKCIKQKGNEANIK